MAKTSVQCEFDLSASELWDLVGDFGNMSKWTGLPRDTCVADGEGIGATRTLRLPNGGMIVDRLDAETERSYSYSIINNEESPLPFRSYNATLSVEPISAGKCQLDWAGEFEPDGISEQEAIDFAKAMYSRGLGMMKKAEASLLEAKESARKG